MDRVNPTEVRFDDKTLTAYARYDGEVRLEAKLESWCGGYFYGINFSGPYAQKKKLMSFGAGTCLRQDQARDLAIKHCQECIKELRKAA